MELGRFFNKVENDNILYILSNKYSCKSYSSLNGLKLILIDSKKP